MLECLFTIVCSKFYNKVMYIFFCSVNVNKSLNLHQPLTPFKLWLFHLTYFIIWNIKGLRDHVSKILWLSNSSLWYSVQFRLFRLFITSWKGPVLLVRKKCWKIIIEKNVCKKILIFKPMSVNPFGTAVWSARWNHRE